MSEKPEDRDPLDYVSIGPSLGDRLGAVEWLAGYNKGAEQMRERAAEEAEDSAPNAYGIWTFRHPREIAERIRALPLTEEGS